MTNNNAENQPEEPKAFYESNKIYEITLNPDNRHQYFDNIVREKKCIDYMIKMLTPLQERCKWELYPELSEPRHANHETGLPRWHWHGKIIFQTDEDIVFWLLTYQIKLQQHMDIKISDYRPDYWPLYIKKQTYMKKYLQSHKLPYQLSHKTNRRKILCPTTYKEESG